MKRCVSCRIEKPEEEFNLPPKSYIQRKKKIVLLKKATFLNLMVKYPSLWGLVQRQHATLWTWKLGFESLIPSLKGSRERVFYLYALNVASPARSGTL
jgi:hypothetical protein